MNKKQIFIAIRVAMILFSLLVSIFRPVPAAASSGGTSYDEIDRYIEQQMERLNLPGVSMVIVENDQIVHMRGFGEAIPDMGEPTPNTNFIIGSTTKSFTALAIMQLVEDGKVELDAPVQQYLPWFRVADPQASVQITVRNLLNQDSSLPLIPAWQQLADFDASPDATERQARDMAALELKRPVGSAFEYSNVNYNLLGLIVEAASGETYSDYIRQHIFTPLDMDHSYTSKTDAMDDEMAVGNLCVFGFPIPVPNLPIPSGSIPSGQIVSNADDMSHYLMMYLNHGSYLGEQLLSPDGIQTLHNPGVEAISAGIPMGYYGMGWYISEKDGVNYVHHTGMVPDYYTYMALLPEQEKGVLMMVNVNYLTHEMSLTEIGEGVLMMMAGEEPEKIQFAAIPWIVRALLIIPVLQIFGIVSSLKRYAKWHRNAELIPNTKRLWIIHIILPGILNLILVASGLMIVFSNVRGFLFLFIPDISFLAIFCGIVAGVWLVVRNILIFQFSKRK